MVLPPFLETIEEDEDAGREEEENFSDAECDKDEGAWL